jgi:hypothetical protein
MQDRKCGGPQLPRDTCQEVLFGPLQVYLQQQKQQQQQQPAGISACS